MQIDRRYADYGLTGGFFLICQLGLLWALGYWPRVTPAQLKALLPSETPLLAPIITGFAGALAVIAVFVVGLILDLLASLWRGMEMKIFARHLDHNSEWMTAFIEAHKAYCGYDYETFQRAFHDPPSRGKRAAAMFTLGKRESRLRLEAGLKVEWGLGIASQYERLLSFFTSYIIGQSGSAQLTLMADQYSLWRTARAIATALYLLILELILEASYLLIFIFVLPIEGFSVPIAGSKVYFFALCLTILGVGVTTLIIRGTYSRLCFTLFSLGYVACDKQIVSRKDADPVP
jgi:hypothetical protein